MDYAADLPTRSHLPFTCNHSNADLVEMLCMLFTTAGQTLDIPRAAKHMDAYFRRLEALAKGPSVYPHAHLPALQIPQISPRAC